MGAGVTIEDEKRKSAFALYVLPELEVLLRVAKTLTGRSADAEDLVQDTMLRAFRSIDGFDGKHPRAWLLTIMRNAEINRHRKRRPDLLSDPEATIAVLANEPTHEGNPERVAEDLLDSRVANALAALPPLFRCSIELIDLGGLSYAEAGELLGVPSGTVMSRVHRGRSRIRTFLKDNGIDLTREDV